MRGLRRTGLRPQGERAFTGPRQRPGRSRLEIALAREQYRSEAAMTRRNEAGGLTAVAGGSRGQQ